tara:strand:+ start:1148 stop:1594 length:447 start_codon:yes stop_codon:yes gene_type:complete
MIIKKLKEILNPPKKEVETQTTILQKKAGTYKVECAIDEEVVDCKEMSSTPYTGVPAPVVLSNDSWFGDVTYKSQKQLDYMEKETEMKRQEREKNFSVEPDDIHQKMYEIATKNQNTTLQLNPLGGSENFHEGPGGWNSGNGMGQFLK